MALSYSDQGEALLAKLQRLIATPNAQRVALSTNLVTLLRESGGVRTNDVYIQECALMIVGQKALTAPTNEDAEYHNFSHQIARDPLSRANSTAQRPTAIDLGHTVIGYGPIVIDCEDAEYNQYLFRLAKNPPSRADTRPLTSTPMAPSQRDQAVALLASLRSLLTCTYAQGVALATNVRALIRDPANTSNDDIYVQELAINSIYVHKFVQCIFAKEEYQRQKALYLAICAETTTADERLNKAANLIHDQERQIDTLSSEISKANQWEEFFPVLKTMLDRDVESGRDDLIRQHQNAVLDLQSKEDELRAAEEEAAKEDEQRHLRITEAKKQVTKWEDDSRVHVAECGSLRTMFMEVDEKIREWMTARGHPLPQTPIRL